MDKLILVDFALIKDDFFPGLDKMSWFFPSSDRKRAILCQSSGLCYRLRSGKQNLLASHLSNNFFRLSN